MEKDGKGTCEIEDKLKCENRWKERKITNGKWTCIKKVSPNQNDDAFGKMDSWAQNNLLDRDQVSSVWDSSFANPFEKIEAMFEEVPLINLRTENITVKVPMISSEDITAYIHMSSTWIDKQKKILEEWFDLLKAMIWFCGWSKDINNFKDLKVAFYDLKDQLKWQLQDEVKWKTQ